MTEKINSYVCDHCRRCVPKPALRELPTRKAKKRTLVFCGKACAFDSLSPLQKADAIKAWIDEYGDEQWLHEAFAKDPQVFREEMTWEYWLWAEAERQLKE